MKVLFLDFDGVLNSTQEVIYHGRLEKKDGNSRYYDFCPIACSNVQYILEEVLDLKIVISSTWRLGNTLERLREILQNNGIDSSRVIGVTPEHDENTSPSRVRGDQIKAWLSLHPEVTQYAIIDDDNDMLISQRPFFFRTDRHHGLQWKSTKAIIKLLNGKSSRVKITGMKAGSRRRKNATEKIEISNNGFYTISNDDFDRLISDLENDIEPSEAVKRARQNFLALKNKVKE